MVSVFGAAPIPGLSVAGGYKLMVEDRGGLRVAALQDQTDDAGRASSTAAGAGRAPRRSSARNTPQLFMDIDRSKAETLGVSLDDVDDTLQMFLGSLYVNSFNQFGRYWQVDAPGGRAVSRPDRGHQPAPGPQQVKGEMVPLGTLAKVREVGGPVMVQRYNLYTAAPINGNLRPGTSSGPAIERMDATARATLPAR